MRFRKLTSRLPKEFNDSSYTVTNESGKEIMYLNRCGKKQLIRGLVKKTFITDDTKFFIDGIEIKRSCFVFDGVSKRDVISKKQMDYIDKNLMEVADTFEMKFGKYQYSTLKYVYEKDFQYLQWYRKNLALKNNSNSAERYFYCLRQLINLNK